MESLAELIKGLDEQNQMVLLILSLIGVPAACYAVLHILTQFVLALVYGREESRESSKDD